MEKNKNLGEILKEYRIKSFPDMGLRRVASEVGIDYAHLFRIEAGQYTPSDESLMKMLTTYKVTDPTEKLTVFNLAHLTPSYQEIINQTANQHEKNPQAFVDAFYRKQKKEKKDNGTKK